MRQIRPEMISLIDAALAKNGLAQHHIETRNPRGLMVEAAKSLVGHHEATGKNDGFFVETVQKTVDGKAQREPWCMAFTQTMISYAEYKLGIKSPLYATEHCLTLWGHATDDQKVKYNPLAGAIVIWQHGQSSNGHTGIVLSADETSFYAVEGNASGYLVPVDQVTKGVNREGNGVYYTKRSRKGDGDMIVKGFIKPFPAVLS
jgi:hypothetical protein